MKILEIKEEENNEYVNMKVDINDNEAKLLIEKGFTSLLDDYVKSIKKYNDFNPINLNNINFNFYSIFYTEPEDKKVSYKLNATNSIFILSLSEAKKYLLKQNHNFSLPNISELRYLYNNTSLFHSGYYLIETKYNYKIVLIDELNKFYIEDVESNDTKYQVILVNRVYIL